MKITDLKIRRIFNDPGNRLKALVSITIDDCLAIHEIRVIQGDDRFFVAMPSRKDDNGGYRDIVHPIHAQLRQEFESIILKAYHNQVELFGNTDSDNV